MGRFTQIFLTGLTLFVFTILFTACGGEGGTEVGNPPAQQTPDSGNVSPPPPNPANNTDCDETDTDPGDPENCKPDDESGEQNPDENSETEEAPEESEAELFY